LLIALMAVVASAALALTGFSPKGRTVTVAHAAVTATYVDAGVPGTSVGDMRLFEYPTAIKGGEAAGGEAACR
jgi:hypothetical protein